MKAVRTARHDLEHLIAVERLDGVFGEHLIQILVPHAPRRITMAVLFLAEDREANAARLEDAREGDADLLRAIVERSHAADPEEHVGAFAALEKLGHRGNVHSLGPLAAIRATECPRRSIALERLKRGLQLRREAR